MSLGNDCHQSFCEHIYSAGRMVENQKHDILNLVTTKTSQQLLSSAGIYKKMMHVATVYHSTATTIIRYSYML